MLHKVCLDIAKHTGSVFTRLNVRYLSIKVAVIGSGPAGFYTTQKLLKHPDVSVDIYEKLPVPFGLIRYGVAPDHQEVKNVINSFTSVANSQRVNFFGNVDLGKSVKLDEILLAYHAVVLCYGSSQDKMLNIDGEHTSKNTISARNFVGWYNGVPEDKDLKIDLNCDTACIIGQGNVALDCARILMKPLNLEKTDITSYAHSQIAKSRIRKIYIIGRRGPLQVSFTTKELREIIKLNESNTRLEPENVFMNISLEGLRTLTRQRRRLTELLLNLRSIMNKDKFDGIECVFKFLSKPTKIIADDETEKVCRLELQRMKFSSPSDFLDEMAVPKETNDYETINCGLVIRSIGYKAVMVDKCLPMNQKLGSIMNTEGRVHGYRNLYCSGWLATGASGVIAGTLNSSHITAQSIIEDIQSKTLPNLSNHKLGSKEISHLLSARSVQVVHFNDWLRIDELERNIGESLGKTREKFVDIDIMLKMAKGQEVK